jgi:hypothetical protein
VDAGVAAPEKGGRRHGGLGRRSCGHCANRSARCSDFGHWSMGCCSVMSLGGAWWWSTLSLRDYTVLIRYSAPDRHVRRYNCKVRQNLSQSHHPCDPCSNFRSHAPSAMSVHTRAHQNNLSVCATLVYARHIHGLYSRRYVNFDMVPDHHERLHN